MKSVFEEAAKGNLKYSNKFLLITKGGDDCGTISVFNFEHLKIDSKKKSIYIDVGGGIQWNGGQEPLLMDLEYRNTEPYNRFGSCYIPHPFAVLNIIPTSNGSRFLSLCRSWKIGGFMTRIDKPNLAIVFTKREFKKTINKSLLEIGVPKKDLSKITHDISRKMKQK